METPPVHPAADARRLRRCFSATLAFTAVLWLVKLAELIFGWDFSTFGVYPRHWIGLRGILLAPLIHGSVGHSGGIFPYAIRLLAAKRIDVSPLVTARYSLDQAIDAIKRAETLQDVKVMVLQ